MNILVSPSDRANYYFRSDSTMVRALEDYYIPDYIGKLSVVPVVCFRLCRAGKSIARPFVHRFIGPFNHGILLKPELADSSAPNRDFIENSLDYTTVIPLKMYPVEQYSRAPGNVLPFKVEINGKCVFETDSLPPFDTVLEEFHKISGFCSVRTGDFLALEISGPVNAAGGDYITAVSGTDRICGITVR